jgi:hypothetical protein
MVYSMSRERIQGRKRKMVLNGGNNLDETHYCSGHKADKE